MSKTKPHQVGEPADIHARIKSDAQRLRAAPVPGVRDAEDLPELAALMRAAQAEVDRAVPRSFVFQGRRYWLQVRTISELHVFASAVEATPLVSGVNFGRSQLGHSPAH